MSERVVQVSQDVFQKAYGGGEQKKGRKTRKQQGGNSGALLQLAAQSAPAGMVAPETQSLAEQYAAATKAAMAQLGPSKIQSGGMSPGSISQIASSRGPPTTPGAPAPEPVVSGLNPSQPGPAQAGGSKVVLVPRKRKTRIALRAKRMNGGSDSIMTAKMDIPPSVGGGKTHKARKFHLRVKGVTSRLNKAKKAKKLAHTAPISTIRTKLEKAGVIKKGSKAPEEMLRTMYADLLITKKGL